MRSTTAEATIEVLRALFSRYGLPLELDLQGGSLSPGKSSQIPSKDNSEMSRKSVVISAPTVDNDIELEGSDDSGCKSSDTAIARPSESEPGPVVTRSGRVIKPPNRLSF